MTLIKNFFWKLRVLLGVFFVIGTLEAQQEITAKWVETQLLGSSTERTYSGRVAFVDSLKELQIRADTAIVRGNEYVFASNLVFNDKDRQVKAKTLIFNDQSRVAKFTGQVLFKDLNHSLQADSVEFHPDSNYVSSSGQVFFRSTENNQEIRSREFWFYNKSETGGASGNVRVVLVGNSEDSLHIQTDSLGFKLSPESFQYYGRSQIFQSRMSLTSGSGQFGDTWLKTVMEPVVVWQQDGQADSITAKADSIDVKFVQKVATEMLLQQNVELVLVGVDDSTAFRQVVTGNSAIIQIEQDQIAQMSIFNNIEMEFVRDSTRVLIDGDSSFAWFKRGKLDSVEVFGQSTGIFEVPDKGKGTITGTHQTLWFEENKLVRLRAEGDAVCTYLNSDNNKVNVGGDLVDIFFEDGDLDKIEANGKVDGLYLQNKATK